MKENKVLLTILIVWLIALWPTGIDCSVFTDYEREKGDVPGVCVI